MLCFSDFREKLVLMDKMVTLETLGQLDHLERGVIPDPLGLTEIRECLVTRDPLGPQASPVIREIVAPMA